MDHNRVILINGDNSEWYEQAIFIVKKNIPAYKVPTDFVMEAEKLINRYLATKVRESAANVSSDLNTLKRGNQPPKSRFSLIVNIILLAGIAALITALYLSHSA